MKKLYYFLATMGAAFVITITGCKKNQEQIADPQTGVYKGEISLEGLVKDLKTIRAMGFDAMSARAVADGYIVEGDIHLDRKLIDAGAATQPAQQEQYSSQYKIATSGLRTINVALVNSANLSNLNTAFDNMVKDVNNLKLPTLKFARVTNRNKADITLVYDDLGGKDKSGITLGQDGAFVDPYGDPGNLITLNSNPDAGYATASLAKFQNVVDHEFGHAIGLRHTDYRDRFYGLVKASGYDPNTQDAVLTAVTKDYVDKTYGTGTWDSQSASSKASYRKYVFDNMFGPLDEGEGYSFNYSKAAHLYGTPLTPTYTNDTFTSASDEQSIMLSYSNTVNLTFSAYDTIALFDLYGSKKQIALIKSYLTSEGAITAAATAKGITTIDQVVAAVKATI